MATNSPIQVYVEISIGSAVEYAKQVAQYQLVVSWLDKNHATYSLPPHIAELNEVERETVDSLYAGENVGRVALYRPFETVLVK